MQSAGGHGGLRFAARPKKSFTTNGWHRYVRYGIFSWSVASSCVSTITCGRGCCGVHVGTCTPKKSRADAELCRRRALQLVLQVVAGAGLCHFRYLLRTQIPEVTEQRMTVLLQNTQHANNRTDTRNMYKIKSDLGPQAQGSAQT